MRRIPVGLALLCAALTACTTTRTLPLHYVPSDAARAQAGRTIPISMGDVQDRRANPGSTIGTMHSGVGKTTKILETNQPLTAVVRQFFIDALEQQNSYSPNSPNQIQVEILDFQADQLIRRDVFIDLLVTLRDARTGRTRATAPVKVQKAQGGLLNADNLVRGNVSAFQRFVEQALSEAVDEGVRKVAPPAP